MARQKFRRGNAVHIAKSLGAWMSHFESDADVVIIGSYCDQYHSHGRPMLRVPTSNAPVADHTVAFNQPEDCCGPNGHSYTVMFEDGGTISWYCESQLTLIREGGESEIERIQAAKLKREEEQTNLDWILANWASIRSETPGNIAKFLMGLVGISEPWGSQGEGLAYHANWAQTFALLDPALSRGSISETMDFLKTVKMLKGVDVRIGH